MDVAFLFNASHPTLGGAYGDPIRERILATNVLQSTGRQMRISLGDVLSAQAVAHSSSATLASHREFCRSLYSTTGYSSLVRDVMEEMYDSARVHCWVFQNADERVVERLDVALSEWEPYLGALEVEFDNPAHLSLFRNSLVECYRVFERSWSLLYNIDNVDPQPFLEKELTAAGFRVDYEDSGARRTILDDYDTAAHFRRVGDFRRLFAMITGEPIERISELVFALEELHPRLFDVLAAYVRAVSRAETDEDLAQAAMSGRRFLEALADYLFPAVEGARKGRRLGKAEYKNRIWAYVEDAAIGAPDPGTTVAVLGQRVDTLVRRFNGGLHAAASRAQVIDGLRELVSWTAEVIRLNPAAARRPYLAYADNIAKLAHRALGDT